MWCMLHSTIAAWFFTLICMVLSQHKKSIFDLVLSTVSHATKFFFDQMCMITWYSVFTFELFLKHLWLWFKGDPKIIHNWISGDHIWSKKNFVVWDTVLKSESNILFHAVCDLLDVEFFSRHIHSCSQVLHAFVWFLYESFPNEIFQNDF